MWLLTESRGEIQIASIIEPKLNSIQHWTIVYSLEIQKKLLFFKKKWKWNLEKVIIKFGRNKNEIWGQLRAKIKTSG